MASSATRRRRRRILHVIPTLWSGAGDALTHLCERQAEHDDVLVCRRHSGKLTLVHRRLWPALAALAGELPANVLARVRQVHTAAGKHVNEEIPFPQWLPPDAAAEAASMAPDRARTALSL